MLNPSSDARAPIYLIESPSPEDLYHGRNEGQSLVNILSLGDIEVTYFLVSDIERFRNALHDVAVMIGKRRDNKTVLPFVHISAHASEDGIELTDGDCVYWGQLIEEFEKLHLSVGEWSDGDVSGKFPKCSLSLSSCSAFLNLKSIIGSEMPLQAVIGPIEDVGWCQSLLAFSVFYYQAFSQKQSFHSAVSAMNAATCVNGASVFSLKVTERLEKLAGVSPSTVVALRFAASDISGRAAVTGLDVESLPSPGRHIR